MLDFIQNIDVNALLEHQFYGYLLILVWTFLEGETIVVLAGIAASQGYLDPKIIALCAFVGSCASDQIMFCLGKYKGAALLNRFPKLSKNVDKAGRLIKKYDIFLILGFRFVYGIRNVTPIMLGISHVKHVKFIVLNIIGAAIWACSFTAGGYYLGVAFEETMKKVGSSILYGVVGVIVLVALAVFIRKKRKKSQQKISTEPKIVAQTEGLTAAHTEATPAPLPSFSSNNTTEVNTDTKTNE